MTFNPLGNFNSQQDIAQALIDGGRAYKLALPVCPPGTLTRIYGHWTVGHLGQDFPDYNGSVRYDGAYHLDIPHDPRDNAVGVDNNAAAAHTWLRNSGAFGIATDDMVFANEHDFGDEGLTLSALAWLCTGVAAVASKYGIDLSGVAASGIYKGEPTFLTHAEAAVRGGNPADPAWYSYGPSGTCERWDLSTFVPLPSGIVVTDAMATTCGDALRTLAHRIKLALD